MTQDELDAALSTALGNVDVAVERLVERCQKATVAYLNGELDEYRRSITPKANPAGILSTPVSGVSAGESEDGSPGQNQDIQHDIPGAEVASPAG